jgi:polyphenol oxidase
MSLLYGQPEWTDAMPWLINGITAGADMSLFGASPAGEVVPRWLRLGRDLACDHMVHARQVHEAAVLRHVRAAPGLLIAGDADGHATDREGVLLAVSVADCVPISVVAPDVRAIALLHGGWRGVVAGILERGIDVLTSHYAADPAAMLVHCGPAICGACFEVGPEVPAALGLDAVDAVQGTGRTDDRCHVDLRAALAHRALALGVPAEQVSVSAFCTRCGDSPFYSHRAGCRERQISVLAVTADGTR